MRRFLDPTTASSSNDSTSEIVEHKTREIENLNINGIVHVDRTYNSINENKLRKVGSYYSTQMGPAGPDFLKEISCERHGEDGSWDLEANESKDKSFFHKNNWRGCYSRTNIFEFFGNLWSAYGNTGRVSRNFTKRLKDGEEQRHSQSYVDISHAAKGHHIRMRLASGYRSFQRLCSELFTRIMHSRSWLGTHMANRIQNNQHSIRWILALLFTLIVLDS
ncbi:hypothetical protein L1049_008692 [Liquidambar formosana]|uniref:Uncharacterized protein n=1 Tax=Liquidambar formosana TaxID=63359 RepID=A0AAP0S9T5_LIQFO